MSTSDQCVKGINWGEITTDDKFLSIKHNKQSVMRIPMKKIINSKTQKNDIVLQLSTDDCDAKYYYYYYYMIVMICYVR